MADAVVVATNLTTGTSTGAGAHSSARLWQVFTAEVLNGTAVVDSLLSATNLGFNLKDGGFFGLWIKGVPGAGTANYTVSIVQSYHDGTAADYVAPDAGSVIGTVADNNPHIFALSPTALPFLRLRVTGIGANPASTALTAFLWQQG